MITAIYPIRQTAKHHRDIDRLELSKRSLQVFAPAVTEYVWADSCSEEPYATELVKLAESCGIKLFRCGMPHVWNKSKIFNAVARHITADYLMMIDADMLALDPAVNNDLERMDSSTFLTFSIYNLTECSPKNFDKGWVDSHSRLRNKGRSCGGIQVFPSEWFNRVHGMHEKYELWGREDEEFARYATETGLRWIKSKAKIYHTPHASSRDTYDPTHSQWAANKQLYNQHAPRTKEWGQLPLIRVN